MTADSILEQVMEECYVLVDEDEDDTDNDDDAEKENEETENAEIEDEEPEPIVPSYTEAKMHGHSPFVP